MSFVRLLLLVIGVVATMLFICVRHDYTTTPAGEVTETVTRIGFPSSPWYHRVERDGGVTMDVNFLSLGGVSGLVAVGCFWGYWRTRRKVGMASP